MADSDMTTEAPAFRNRSTSIAALAGALATAQKAFAPIPKDREVTVTTQTGGIYKFKYATLDAILAATMPALAEQKIAVSQALTSWGDNYAVETTLYHESGEWMSNVTPMFLVGRKTREGRELPPGNQELGSAQTYARRYGFSALVCITADEDEDGNHADGNHAEGSERVPYRAAKGSAGGGGDFRPAGPRQGSASGHRMAMEEPHLVANAAGRLKGTMPNKPTPVTAIEKARDWTDKAIETLNLSDHSVDSLSKFLSENNDKIEWLEAKAPTQHERFFTAYNNAAEAARAKVAA